MFFEGFGTNFDDVVPWRQALNMIVFHGCLEGVGGMAEIIRSVGGNLHCLWSPFQQPQSLQELIQGTKYTIKHAGLVRKKTFRTRFYIFVGMVFGWFPTLFLGVCLRFCNIVFDVF